MSILVNWTVGIMETNSIELIRGFPQSNSRQQRFQRGHPFGRGCRGTESPCLSWRNNAVPLLKARQFHSKYSAVLGAYSAYSSVMVAYAVLDD